MVLMPLSSGSGLVVEKKSITIFEKSVSPCGTASYPWRPEFSATQLKESVHVQGIQLRLLNILYNVQFTKSVYINCA
jgi:hypothetical protein